MPFPAVVYHRQPTVTSQEYVHCRMKSEQLQFLLARIGQWPLLGSSRHSTEISSTFTPSRVMGIDHADDPPSNPKHRRGEYRLNAFHRRPFTNLGPQTEPSHSSKNVAPSPGIVRNC
jgi:hypothetical protein